MADFDSINPEKGIPIDKIDYVSIDVSKYGNNYTYGKLGSNAQGSTSLINKLNHRTTYDPTNTNNPYSYEFEGDAGDVNGYDYISKTNNDNSSDKSRTLVININGDTSRDEIGVDNNTSDIGGGKQFAYNAGNTGQSYSDGDLWEAGKGGLIVKQEGNEKVFYRLLDTKDASGEYNIEKLGVKTDDYNTSNTMTKTMNYYDVTVKPMAVRSI